VRILQGFANPALITVLALLVLGQGMIRTGVLDRGASLLLGARGGRGGLLVSLLLILLVAMIVSAFLNNIPVRFPNELCRHKALDLVGDMYLLGRPIKGHVLGARSGHAANHELCRKIREYLTNNTITPVTNE